VDIDAIQQGAGDAVAVALHLLKAAATLAFRVAEEAAEEKGVSQHIVTQLGIEIGSTEEIPVQAPILNRFAEVIGGDLLGVVQIRDGAGDF